jgi:hypothetical protein
MKIPLLWMHVWPTNQPTNQWVNWFHASWHPLFCLAIPTLTTFLGSVTNIFSYNWDCAYANDFPPWLKTSTWANWGPQLVYSECLAFYMWPLCLKDKRSKLQWWVEQLPMQCLMADGTAVSTGRFWVAVLLWLLQLVWSLTLVWRCMTGPFLVTVGSSHISLCVGLFGFWTSSVPKQQRSSQNKRWRAKIRNQIGLHVCKILHTSFNWGYQKWIRAWIKQKFKYSIFKGSTLLGCDAVSLGKNGIE